MRSNNKRSRVIDAAIEVVQQSGANHLTIDAVAARAGFSKGGVLYHFPSKHALLQGMLERLIHDEDERAGGDDSNLLRSMLLKEPDLLDDVRNPSLAILAAAAEDTRLLDTAREYMKHRFDEVMASVEDVESARVLFLANEGIRFLELLNITPLSRQETNRVLDALAVQAEKLS